MSESNQTMVIQSETLKDWLQRNQVDLYDVREPNEFKTGHIRGSILVPLSTFDLSKIDTSTVRNIVFYCKSGVRCGIASNLMRSAGFQGPLYRLEGGIVAWEIFGGVLDWETCNF